LDTLKKRVEMKHFILSPSHELSIMQSVCRTGCIPPSLYRSLHDSMNLQTIVLCAERPASGTRANSKKEDLLSLGCTLAGAGWLSIRLSFCADARSAWKFTQPATSIVVPTTVLRTDVFAGTVQMVPFCILGLQHFQGRQRGFNALQLVVEEIS
jgi:hypothetical protein